MVLGPSVVPHTLTHEQVMPFLRKLEQGQLREGVFFLIDGFNLIFYLFLMQCTQIVKVFICILLFVTQCFVCMYRIFSSTA